LPFSSRNALMTPSERHAARCVVDAVRLAKDLYDTGERDAAAIAGVARERIAREPGATPDYAAVVDRESFEDVTSAAGDPLVIVAADLGRLRVLDNLPLSRPLPPEITAADA
jgi:pantoate--beta-alanine ligase